MIMFLKLIQALTEHAKNFNICQCLEQLSSCSSSGLVTNESTSEPTNINSVLCNQKKENGQDKKFKSE